MPAWINRTSAPADGVRASAAAAARSGLHRPRRCGTRCSDASTCASPSSSATASAVPGGAGPCGVAHRRRGTAALLDLRGQPDLFGRTLAGQHDRLCRRDRRRRIAAAGPGGRGAAGRARARARLDGARCTRPRSWCGPPARTCSGEHGWWLRCPAASAAPSWRSASAACCRPTSLRSSPTPATTSSISVSPSRPTSTR